MKRPIILLEFTTFTKNTFIEMAILNHTITDWLTHVDDEILQSYVDRGLVQVQYHYELPLRIIKYTRQCTYENAWDNFTLQCRGLVIDDTGNVVGRGPNKFFNHFQLTTSQIPSFDEPHNVYRKEDGSLGIIFKYEGEIVVATQGSFHSEQAQWAKAYLDKLDEFDIVEGTSLWVEIVFPENRIVMDYQGYEGLIVLGNVNNSTGEEVAWDELDIRWPLLDKVGKINQTGDWFYDKDDASEEGVIVHWPGRDNFRIKIKYPTYIQRHAIITNFSKKKVWDRYKEARLANDKNWFPEFVASFPDELHIEIKKYKHGWDRRTSAFVLDQYVWYEKHKKDEARDFARELQQAEPGVSHAYQWATFRGNKAAEMKAILKHIESEGI